MMVIILAGVLVGIETNKTFATAYVSTFKALNTFILVIFILEILIKVLAEGKTPWKYFATPWNIFDFTIVAVCLIDPLFGIDTSFVSVLRLMRLFRVLRVLRLVTVLSELQILVGTLLRSISSIMYIGMFLLLIFYIYGTMAVMIFGENDPIHFRNLPVGMLSLFRVVTLEDWTDVMYINMYGCDKYGYQGDPRCTPETAQAMPLGSPLFFVSFVAIGTMIVLNLFIGVIMTSMSDVQNERQMESLATRRNAEQSSILDEIRLIQKQMDDIKTELDLIGRRVNTETISRNHKQSHDASS